MGEETEKGSAASEKGIESSVPEQLQRLIDFDDGGLIKKALRIKGRGSPVAHAFPLNDDDTRNLVVLAEGGHMMVVSPPHETSRSQIQGHRLQFGRNLKTGIYDDNEYNDLLVPNGKALAHHYERIGLLRADTLTYQDKSHFGPFVAEAVDHATKTLAARGLSAEPDPPAPVDQSKPRGARHWLRRIPKQR